MKVNKLIDAVTNTSHTYIPIKMTAFIGHDFT